MRGSVLSLLALFLLSLACSRPAGLAELRPLTKDVADPPFTLTLAPAPEGVGPKRVVCLIPSLTEAIHALGFGGRLVGRDRWSDAPPSVTSLPSVGDQRTFSAERIADLRPDLVVTWPRLVELRDALTAHFGLRVLTPDTESGDALSGILEVATALGDAERGRTLVALLEKTRAESALRYAHLPPRSLLLVLDRSSTGIFVAGAGSFLDAAFTTLQFQNSAGAPSEGPWRLLSLEHLRELTPDVVVDLSLGDSKGGLADAQQFWGRFSAMPAVQSGRVYVGAAPVLVRPGPRFYAALAKLGEQIRDS